MKKQKKNIKMTFDFVACIICQQESASAERKMHLTFGTRLKFSIRLVLGECAKVRTRLDSQVNWPREENTSSGQWLVKFFLQGAESQTFIVLEKNFLVNKNF